MTIDRGLRRREWLALGAGAIVIGPVQARPAQQHRLFGSFAELHMPSRSPSLEAQVWTDLRMLDTQWNAWKPGELVELNHALRRGARAAVTPRLAQALHDATRLEIASRGCFNPAIGALVAAWGFHRDRLDDGGGPSAALLRRWQAQPAPSLAALDWRGDRVACGDARVQIDLGAVGKGIAADAALDRLVHEGIGDALVNLGGHVAAMGRNEGRAWHVGIRNPHRDGLLTVIETSGREAVVTSGTYERRRIAHGPSTSSATGLAIHHVIDPVSARPAPALDSVTVVHPRADVADAAATALLVAGPVRWRNAAHALGATTALVVHADARVEATPAMSTRIGRATTAMRR